MANKNINDHLDETQIVSLKDLEELEYLQLTQGSKNGSAVPRRSSLPMSVLLGLLLTIVVAAVLAAAYIHFGSHPAAAQAGGR